jgi:hypothetical protein
MKTERSYMHAPLRKRTVAMSDSVQLLLSAATDFQERLQFRKQSSPALIARWKTACMQGPAGDRARAAGGARRGSRSRHGRCGRIRLQHTSERHAQSEAMDHAQFEIANYSKYLIPPRCRVVLL